MEALGLQESPFRLFDKHRTLKYADYGWGLSQESVFPYVNFLNLISIPLFTLIQ